jgi:hypothetical protein
LTDAKQEPAKRDQGGNLREIRTIAQKNHREKLARAKSRFAENSSDT